MNDRLSGEFKLESIPARISRYLIGLLIIAGGAYSQWIELHTDRNGWHELGYWFALLIGATVIYPRLLKIVTGYGGIVGPYIPGGRRSYDPPVKEPPAIPPKTD